MTDAVTRPDARPVSPLFSSGPCAKRPGWSLDVLDDASIRRSHRAKGPKAKLQRVIEDSRAILGIPEDYRIGIVPASDTGAFEMAMWSMLGARGLDILAWESFGQGWVTDIVKQLKLEDIRVLEAPTEPCPIWVRWISAAMSYSPGTGRPPACGFPMATGSRPTGKV